MAAKKTTEKKEVKEVKPKTSAKKVSTAKTKQVANDEVTVEKTADGVIEVKKLDTTQNTAEELSIEQKLLSLYNLQQICSKIDDIRMIRGELPEEIRDNEDECEGKKTRITNLEEEIKTLKNREYAARGIPFIYSETDSDFDDMPYVLKAPADESPIDIYRIIDFYRHITLSPQQIRNSIDNLSWENQMRKVIEAVIH